MTAKLLPFAMTLNTVKAATIVNASLANDISLCFTNDGDMYRKYSLPIINQFKSDIADGKFNSKLAALVWYDVLNKVNLHCVCNLPVTVKFNPATLYEAAEQIADYYLDHINSD